jgi:hypothetical protein
MKLADLNISNDACGPYVINIYGNDRSSFIIRNNGLYFKDDVILNSRVKNNYSIIIAIEDFSKRFPPLTRSYSVTIVNCFPTTTTTTTTTTVGFCSQNPTVCTGLELRLDGTNDKYVLTNLYLNIGESFSVDVRGCTTCQVGNILGEATPDGPIVSNEDTFMLVKGVINSNPAADMGVRYSAGFTVGSHYDGVASSSGYLYLGIYDWKYTDNGGNYCASFSKTTSTTTTTTTTVRPTTTTTTTTTTTPIPVTTTTSSTTSTTTTAAPNYGTCTWQWYQDGGGGWDLIANNCISMRSPTLPSRNGIVDAEIVTTTCS